VIELNPEPAAPRDLAARLAALLTTATGTRWTIALSAEPGEDTLQASRQKAVAAHPLVQTILAAFPGARIELDAEEIEAPPPEFAPRGGAAEGDQGGPTEAAFPEAAITEDPDMEQDA
jgi:DNA polymerase-3 subunit gamma/tau